MSDMIDELEAAQRERDAAKTALADLRATEESALHWLAECRFAAGDNGQRMLDDFVKYLADMKSQLDKLLLAAGEALAVLKRDGDEYSLCELLSDAINFGCTDGHRAADCADTTSVPAMVFYPAGSLGEEIEEEGRKA